MIPAGGLLDIDVIPLEFQTVTTRPTLEVVSHTRGRFEVTRDGGEYQRVKTQNDSADFTRQARIQAYNLAGKTFTAYSSSIKGNADYKSAIHSVKLPSLSGNSQHARHNTSFSDLAFEYTPQEINFDWVRDEKTIKGNPGKVEFYITQYPQVLIDYLGGPIYCPPSMDPNYEENAVDMVV